MPFPSPGHLPDPGIKPTSLVSPALADGFFTTSATWETQCIKYFSTFTKDSGVEELKRKQCNEISRTREHSDVHPPPTSPPLGQRYIPTSSSTQNNLDVTGVAPPLSPLSPQHRHTFNPLLILATSFYRLHQADPRPHPDKCGKPSTPGLGEEGWAGEKQYQQQPFKPRSIPCYHAPITSYIFSRARGVLASTRPVALGSSA